VSVRRQSAGVSKEGLLFAHFESAETKSQIIPLVSTEVCSIDGRGEKTSAGASDEGNSELVSSQASAATTHKSMPLTRKGSTPGDDGPTGAVGSETAAGRQEAPNWTRATVRRGSPSQSPVRTHVVKSTARAIEHRRHG
jgi:hypothetical protein